MPFSEEAGARLEYFSVQSMSVIRNCGSTSQSRLKEYLNYIEGDDEGHEEPKVELGGERDGDRSRNEVCEISWMHFA